MKTRGVKLSSTEILKKVHKISEIWYETTNLLYVLSEK